MEAENSGHISRASFETEQNNLRSEEIRNSIKQIRRDNSLANDDLHYNYGFALIFLLY